MSDLILLILNLFFLIVSFIGGIEEMISLLFRAVRPILQSDWPFPTRLQA